MRAIKSVLVMAGQKKRETNNNQRHLSEQVGDRVVYRLTCLIAVVEAAVKYCKFLIFQTSYFHTLIIDLLYFNKIENFLKKTFVLMIKLRLYILKVFFQINEITTEIKSKKNFNSLCA